MGGGGEVFARLEGGEIGFVGARWRIVDAGNCIDVSASIERTVGVDSGDLLVVIEHGRRVWGTRSASNGLGKGEYLCFTASLDGPRRLSV